MPSDDAISRYIRDLFEWLQANHKPENGATSHSEIAHSQILPESRLPNRQLFVGYERERERKAAEEGAATMPVSAHGDAEHRASADMPARGCCALSPEPRGATRCRPPGAGSASWGAAGS